jgi:hypothetical protein
MVCLAVVILSQLLALRCCNILIPLFAKIDASQFDNLSVRKAGVSHIILDPECSKMGMRWVLWSLTFEHKTERKAISFEFFVKVKNKLSLPSLLQQMEHGSFVLNWQQKGNPWSGTTLNIQGRKLQKVTISRQGHYHYLLGM